ncbi:hypothetical protein FIBSPDRAFT_961710 [Athelia psychrophila]|uniref:Lipoyl synthase N-terminal domain-containing protein n=1 Tax=Athelia psychrophila TaxID=1759441 RepID=A0A166AW71_9AGAM|nr:hypothetical protein FIBSPDRAFT_961710 [Fibularhizoctonia sp. CBS 109695]
MSRATSVINALRSSSVRRAPSNVRFLATPSTKPFSQALEGGPSFDDFVAGDVPDRVVLGNKQAARLPAHLKTKIPTGASFNKIKKDLRGLGLHTVCEEARCPNIGDCWGGGKEGMTAEEGKTSIMLGVGEQEDQVLDALRELRNVDVDVVTFGQYMRPTKRHMKVDRYVEPAEFEKWKKVAEDMGFLYVASGPLVRSSYKAGEFYIENVLKGKAAEKKTKQLAAEESLAASSDLSI